MVHGPSEGHGHAFQATVEKVLRYFDYLDQPTRAGQAEPEKTGETAMWKKRAGNTPVDARGIPLPWSDGKWRERSPAEVKALHEAFLEAERRERARSVSPSCGGGSGLTVREALARLETSFAAERAAAAAVARMEQGLHERRNAQLRDERARAARHEAMASDLYARASSGAIWWMRRILAGGAPTSEPDMHELVGRQLAVMYPTGPSYAAERARAARWT
jgi:hypothetical protein